MSDGHDGYNFSSWALNAAGPGLPNRCNSVVPQKALTAHERCHHSCWAQVALHGCIQFTPVDKD